jgi:aryl-alcohol dehydrogenase-like predicted oxidoreductase
MLRTLGTSGLSVSCVGWGGMPLSLPPRPSDGEAVALILEGLALGVDFVDTADVYCRDDADIGHNERLFAAALARYGGAEGVVVATKGGLRRPGGAWLEAGRPDQLRAACERSLRALAVEQISLYQLHAPDADVPFSESVGELFRLRDEGKIAHVGLSNVSVEELESALALGPVVSVQNRMHPLDLSAVADGVVAACEAANIAFIAYSPVGGRHDRAEVLGHPALLEAGRELGVESGTVALAWLLSLSACIVTIPGASRMASLRASLAARDLQLPAAVVARLDVAFGHQRSPA